MKRHISFHRIYVPMNPLDVGNIAGSSFIPGNRLNVLNAGVSPDNKFASGISAPVFLEKKQISELFPFTRSAKTFESEAFKGALKASGKVVVSGESVTGATDTIFESSCVFVFNPFSLVLAFVVFVFKRHCDFIMSSIKTEITLASLLAVGVKGYIQE